MAYENPRAYAHATKRQQFNEGHLESFASTPSLGKHNQTCGRRKIDTRVHAIWASQRHQSARNSHVRGAATDTLCKQLRTMKGSRSPPVHFCPAVGNHATMPGVTQQCRSGHSKYYQRLNPDPTMYLLPFLVTSSMYTTVLMPLAVTTRVPGPL